MLLVCRKVTKQSEPHVKKVKTEGIGGLKARALDDEDMFKSKTPVVRANAGGMPTTVKKVSSTQRLWKSVTFHHISIFCISKLYWLSKEGKVLVHTD